MLCEPVEQDLGKPSGAIFVHAVSGSWDLYYFGGRYAGRHLGD
jgi:hypothetical protein